MDLPLVTQQVEQTWLLIASTQVMPFPLSSGLTGSLAAHQVIRENIEQMKAVRQIQPSDSNWDANPVIVKKKDGSARVCIDFRALNEDSYPLPRTNEVLNELGKAQWFSKLDLKAGYWQIVLDPEDRHKTAFMTRDGLFEFLVMPFNLTSAPATFQRLMDTVLSDLLWHKVMVFLDDIIVYSETWERTQGVVGQDTCC